MSRVSQANETSSLRPRQPSLAISGSVAELLSSVVFISPHNCLSPSVSSSKRSSDGELLEGQ